MTAETVDERGKNETQREREGKKKREGNYTIRYAEMTAKQKCNRLLLLFFNKLKLS